jgi:hypothetical protein
MLTALTNYQVDKLKVLADSLASSSSKAEQRILEHRFCFWNCFPVKYFVMALRQSRLNKMYFILGCLLRFYSLVETLFPLPYITCSQFLFIIKDSVRRAGLVQLVSASSPSHQVLGSKPSLCRISAGVRLCFGYSLPQTPLVWEPLALGLPFLSRTRFKIS